jgi:EmrB/QacA subfamily drug resistance transporter
VPNPLRLHEAPPLARLAESRHYPWFVVATVCVGAFLGQLDASIAGLVLPTLESTFRAPVAAVEWVAIAYLLVLAALVVPLGRLSDLAGRKMLYTLGFIVFVGGSALCGFAPDLVWLIVFRAVQAVGAAMLQANSVAIITAAIERRRLGRAIGVQAAAQAVGLSIGPSVGGFIIDAFDWRWVFFLAVPFGLVGAVLGWLVLPQTSRAAVRAAHRAQDRFDWAGAALIGPSVALVLAALTFGNVWGWLSAPMALVIGLAIALMVLFVAAERRAASPLVDLDLFKSHVFSVGIVAGVLSYGVLFGSLFLMPFYLERIAGRTPAETGLLLSPIPLAIAVLAPIAGALTDRVGSRAPRTIGMITATVALACLAALPTGPSSAIGPILVALALLGAGLGLFTPPNNSSIMGTVPRNRLGTAGGILNMSRSVGTSLGVAVTGAVLALVLNAQSEQQITNTLEASPAALQVAFHETVVFLAVAAAVSAVFAVFGGGALEHETTGREAAAAEIVGV